MPVKVPAPDNMMRLMLLILSVLLLHCGQPTFALNFRKKVPQIDELVASQDTRYDGNDGYTSGSRRTVSGTNSEWTFGVCLFIRNEGPHILEWIAYHRAIGVTHFFIYDHSSHDETSSVLAPLLNDTVIMHDVGHMDIRHVQPSILMDCLEKYKASVEWIAHFDADEFLVPGPGHTLHSLFTTYDNTISAVYIYRYTYLSSGFRKDPPPTLLACQAYMQRLYRINDAPKWVIRSLSSAWFSGGHNVIDNVTCGNAKGDALPSCAAGNSGTPAEDWMVPLFIAHHEMRSVAACKQKQAYNHQHFPGSWRTRQKSSFCHDQASSPAVMHPSCALFAKETLEQMYCLNSHYFTQRFGQPAIVPTCV
jgi:hypothetical protein